MDSRKLKKVAKILKVTQVALELVDVVEKVNKQAKRRKCWVQAHLVPELRQFYGAYDSVCILFKLENPKEFEGFLRLTPAEFDYLHNMMHPLLVKETSRRQPISSGIRLALTLHYLAHGDSIRTNALLFRVGLCTAYRIIEETCKVIRSVLTPIFVPQLNENKWREISAEFEEEWQFANCLGALDGKHVAIERPPHGGSLFYNYKKFHSVVLMALCDSKSRIIWYAVGDGGSFSDSSVFEASGFAKKLENNELGVPPPSKLPNSDKTMPYVIVADEIFPLRTNIMKPYSRKACTDERQFIYNYRLSRARFTIERAFGILTETWRVLINRIGCKLSTINDIVSSCICLHNLKKTRNLMQSHNPIDNIVVEAKPTVASTSTMVPSQVREQFANYFANEGAVSWQVTKLPKTLKVTHV